MLKNINAVKYNITIGENAINEIASVISQKTRKICIITDDIVEKLYCSKLSELLENKFEIHKFTVKNGENSKCMKNVEKALEFLADNLFSRTDCVVAFGGGVVGDLAGFVASCYMRGIDFIQVPTTLLAGIDSSIGGKTGVNLKAGKNLAGAFHQPRAVIFDTQFLKTLNSQDVKNGLGEGVKYAILSNINLENLNDNLSCVDNCGENEMLFGLLENSNFISENYVINVENDDFLTFITACIQSKVQIVLDDEKEMNARKLLNLGHTFAHAIEQKSGHKIPHGQAVALGIKIISDMCEKTYRLKKEEYERICKLISKFGMNQEVGYSLDDLLSFIQVDKKVSGEMISLITICGIGNCKIEQVKLQDLKDIFSNGFEN